MIHLEMMRFATLVMLSATTALANYTCPPQCQCSDYVIDCNDRGLNEIPDEIPLTARRIDLSNNPSLQVSIDYFLQFQYLFILLLNNCNLQGPIHLPHSVRDVRLDNNALRAGALREMFYNKTTLLMRISLQNNSLPASDVKQVLTILPRNLRGITLNINNVIKLTKKELGQFNDLKTLGLRNCSLNSIEPNVFDNMVQLSQLWIDDGKLNNLPDGLFRYNMKLNYLNIAGNKLTQFNATKLGLTRVLEIDLGYNQIREINVQTLTTRKLWLNHNRIQRLHCQLFRNNSFLPEIVLSGNNITLLCVNAFKTIMHIGELSLHTNGLKSLPKNIFKGKTIMKIRLQRNMLTDVKGIFDGLKSYVHLVDLTENKNLRNISGKDFEALASTTTLYLTCKDLAKITNLSKLRAKILCSPKADLVIHTTNTNGLSCKGYACTYSDIRPLYTCRACKKGYFSSCRHIRKAKSKCIPCPPGSYYQDEPASIMCKTCRPGQFVPPERSPGRDASDCQTCPQGTNTTTPAGTRACKCLSGYSRRYRFGPCTKCYSQGFNCSQDYPVLQSGFWMTWQGTTPEYKASSKYHNVTKRTCEPVYKAFTKNLDITDDSYDRATMHYNCQMPLPVKCPMSRSCLGGTESRCSIEYKGALCAACKTGYTRDFNDCVRCPTRASAATTSIGFVVLFWMCCYIVSVTDNIILKDSTIPMRRGKTDDHQTFADILLSSVKILIGFYQILLTIMQAFSSVYWPHNVKTAIGILQYLQLQIISCPSLHCINPEWEIDAVTELLFILAIITAISMSIILYYSIKLMYIYYQSLSGANTRRYVCGRNCIKFVALCLFATYTLVSTKIIQILPVSCHSFCTLKHNGKCAQFMSFLRYDYSIPCPTMDKSNAILVIGFGCLIIPLGIPIIVFTVLRKTVQGNKRTILHDTDDNDEDHTAVTQMSYVPSINGDADPLLCDSTVPMMTSALRFTYENYNSRYWYWEVTEMMRKLLMTICVVAFVGHNKIGLTCTIIVAMVFVILHAIHKPFKSNYESAAQLLSLILIPMNLVFGAMLQSRNKTHPDLINNEMDTYSLSVFLVVMNSILPFIVLTRITVILAKNIALRLKKSR